jgi:hypothetical protein
VLDRQPLGEERPAPGIVMPPGGADQDAGHRLVTALAGA